MVGHSKWSKAKIGAVFSKLVKNITVAARIGDGDLSGNPRLRSVVETARVQQMPKENVERAIKKGTGEWEGLHYEEDFYEGNASSGVPLLIEAATDNKNRSAADLRLISSQHHGSLAAAGNVHRPPEDPVARLAA